MKRTKEFWSRLTSQERSRLVLFERYQYSNGSGYNMPDDCSECGVCGNGCVGYGPCLSCLNEADRIDKKGQENND